MSISSIQSQAAFVTRFKNISDHDTRTFVLNKAAWLVASGRMDVTECVVPAVLLALTDFCLNGNGCTDETKMAALRVLGAFALVDNEDGVSAARTLTTVASGGYRSLNAEQVAFGRELSLLSLRFRQRAKASALPTPSNDTVFIPTPPRFKAQDPDGQFLVNRLAVYEASAAASPAQRGPQFN